MSLIQSRRRRLPCALGVVLAALAIGVSAAAARTVTYDSFNAKGGYTLSNYAQKWSNPYGLGDMAVAPGDTRSFADGTFYIDDAPFRTSYDFSVYDHLKYIAISNSSFAVPSHGSVTFSSTIKAETPGAVAGRVIHGTYGPPGSYPNGAPWSQSTLEGQQAGAVMNMVDFATGQLFDWFVSGNHAFPLIERLPSSVTGNTADVSSPDYVGPSKMYTQIIKDIPIKAGVTHTVAIRYTRDLEGAHVDYFLDGTRVARVKKIGIPLDRQGVPYTGYAPSMGPGELLVDKINSFSIGHGTFSLLDAFPYQWGWFDVCTHDGLDPLTQEACGLSVSIPTSERLFGQGVRAHFDNFTVKTTEG